MSYWKSVRCYLVTFIISCCAFVWAAIAETECSEGRSTPSARPPPVVSPFSFVSRPRRLSGRHGRHSRPVVDDAVSPRRASAYAAVVLFSVDVERVDADVVRAPPARRTGPVRDRHHQGARRVPSPLQGICEWSSLDLGSAALRRTSRRLDSKGGGREGAVRRLGASSPADGRLRGSAVHQADVPHHRRSRAAHRQTRRMLRSVVSALNPHSRQWLAC